MKQSWAAKILLLFRTYAERVHYWERSYNSGNIWNADILLIKLVKRLGMFVYDRVRTIRWTIR